MILAHIKTLSYSIFEKPLYTLVENSKDKDYNKISYKVVNVAQLMNQGFKLLQAPSLNENGHIIWCLQKEEKKA